MYNNYSYNNNNKLIFHNYNRINNLFPQFPLQFSLHNLHLFLHNNHNHLLLLIIIVINLTINHNCLNLQIILSLFYYRLQALNYNKINKFQKFLQILNHLSHNLMLLHNINHNLLNNL